MDNTVRHPAVAGRFYPGEPQALLSDIRSYFSSTEHTSSAIGCVAPHAGYMYSGHVAGAVYSQLRLPARYIVLCPNHTGMGRALAIMSRGAWETPLGLATVDSALALALKEQFPLLNEDSDAHHSEHAIEVQLPFLQACLKEFSFVPIALGTRQFEVLHGLGEAIASVIKAEGQPILIIASSDMNHYENDAITRIKDHKAIDRILGLDPQGLFDVVMKEDISMCGVGPTIVMLTAARRLGASKAELVKYAASGDVSGDRDRVVGYAGILVN